MWVYGYGSLVWYTNFPVSRSVPGYVKGFSRKFCQASPDHRGTVEQPGRTVTLVHASEDSIVWGVAYEIAKENEEKVRNYLDWREKAGYSTTEVVFHPDPDSNLIPFTVEVYLSPASEDNIYHLRHESLEEIAEQVVKCRGPSGTNIEYVLRLACSIRKMNKDNSEEHLFELEKLVVKLCRERSIQDPVLRELGYDDTNNQKSTSSSNSG